MKESYIHDTSEYIWRAIATHNIFYTVDVIQK